MFRALRGISTVLWTGHITSFARRERGTSNNDPERLVGFSRTPTQCGRLTASDHEMYHKRMSTRRVFTIGK